MKELVYISEGKSHFDSVLIDDMLSKARQHNAQHNITGVLICDKRKRFIQVIEGEAEKVDQLYSNIQQDERHDAVLLIHEADIESRNFEKWTMAFKLSTADFSKLSFYQSLERSKKNSETVQLIKQFYLSGN